MIQYPSCEQQQYDDMSFNGRLGHQGHAPGSIRWNVSAEVTEIKTKAALVYGHSISFTRAAGFHIQHKISVSGKYK